MTRGGKAKISEKTKAFDTRWNPKEQQEEILKEIERYEQNGPLSIMELCKARDRAGAIVYVTDRKEGANGKNHRILNFRALVGSPFYIALAMKQYDEAREILKKTPRSADAGYAALPVNVKWICEKDIHEEKDRQIVFQEDEGIYLEELALTDQGIPDDLFLKLWKLLWNRKRMDWPARTNHYPFLYFQDADIPHFVLEWPCWIGLRLTAGRYGDKNIMKRGFATKEAAAFLKDAENDITLFFRMVKGLLRMKKLNELEYLMHVDEKMLAHFLYKFTSLFYSLLYARYWNSEERLETNAGRVIREIPGWNSISKKLVNAFQLLGAENMTADDLWDACLDYEVDFTKHVDAFRLTFYLWKTLFHQKLTVTLHTDDEIRTKKVLGGIFSLCCKKQDAALFAAINADQVAFYNIEETKEWLELIDAVMWARSEEGLSGERVVEERKTGEKGTGEENTGKENTGKENTGKENSGKRDALEEKDGKRDVVEEDDSPEKMLSLEVKENLFGLMDVLLRQSDKELLWLVFRKNIFPDEVMVEFFRKAEKTAPEFLSLMVLRRHAWNFRPA